MLRGRHIDWAAVLAAPLRTYGPSIREARGGGGCSQLSADRNSFENKEIRMGSTIGEKPFIYALFRGRLQRQKKHKDYQLAKLDSNLVQERVK